MIRLQNVRYRYPSAGWALRGVSLRGERGAYLAVFGANGSGKSTIAYLLNGLIPHFFGGTLVGAVEVCGRDTAQTPVAALFPQVGLVLQNADAQLFNATVEAELAYGLERLGLPAGEIDRRVREYAHLLGVAPLLARSPATLSGGEKRLVAIAAVLCLYPGLLVLDEPFANLDWDECRRVAEVLKRVHARGNTILLIEQRLGPYLQDTDGGIVLEGGRVAFEDAPAAVAAYLARTHLIPGYRPRAGRPAGDAPGGLPLLNVADLHYRVPDRKILRGVTLAVRAGETVALIGRNGSGKTTLIKHLNGLLRPERGDIAWRGATIRGRAPSELAAEIGLAFQNANDQFFKNTVQDELLAGQQRFGRRDDDWVRRIGTLFCLEALMERSPYQLSEGEKKRVAIASLLTMRPKLLVLDEPTAGQDGHFRETLAAVLGELNALGLTTLMATHDIDFARATADRWVQLDEGRIVAEGPPQALRNGQPPAVAQQSARPLDGGGENSLPAGSDRPNRLDPRAKLALGTAAIAAALVAHEPLTLCAQSLLLGIGGLALGRGTDLLRSFRLSRGMVVLVFLVALITLDLRSAALMAVRLLNLLTVSFLFFGSLGPEDMRRALTRLRVPAGFVFILTTAMHYVPLIGRRARQIMDAQQSRGIDLRPRVRNVPHLLALMIPLLVQAMRLSDELALAMESRGYGRRESTARGARRLTLTDYVSIGLALLALSLFIWWERG